MSNKKITFFLIFSFLLNGVIFGQKETPLDVLVFGESNVVLGKTPTLKGQVVDENNVGIPGALIYLVDTQENTVTDEDGHYSLTVSMGIYEINISFLGYEDYKAKIHLFGDGVHEFKITEVAVTLNQVTVSETRKNENVTTTIAGVEQLTIEKIERQAKFLGETDVLRSLQSISGVSSTGEGSSGFNVRGGNTDENLIFQDGNLIMNPVHALGFFSLFHPDLVNKVTLYKGGVPAKYGGRLSSVLSVDLREGNNERFGVKGGLGIASSRLAIEGPIVKNKASFIIGGRISYFDWILSQVKDVDLRRSKAFFYDLTGKFDARITKSTKIGFSGFTTHDEFQFSDEVKFDYSTNTGAAYINQLIGDKFNVRLLVNAGQYKSALFDIKGTDQSRFNNQITYLRASINGLYQVTENYKLELGLEQNRYMVAPGEINPEGEISQVKPDILAEEKGYETAFFLQNTLRLGDKLEILAGLRYTIYKNIGQDEVFLYESGREKTEVNIIESLQFGEDEEIVQYTGFEPRISLRYLVNENSSIKLGYNRSYQFLNQISNTASATPIDIWQLSNYHIQPQKADNFSIGYHANYNDNAILTQITAFYRDIDRLIDYKDFSELLLNEHIETELVIGTGRAYGLELSFNKATGRNRFDVNYTYSRSLRKIDASDIQESVNRGGWYSSNYDKPHILNFNYFLQVGPKSDLSVNFTYSTGRPTTAPISSYSNGNIRTIPIYSERNQFRIPDFHRLDVAYTIGPWGKKANRENSVTFSIYNVYGRRNAFSVFFRQNPFQSVTAYRVAVLGSAFPALTYNFKF